MATQLQVPFVIIGAGVTGYLINDGSIIDSADLSILEFEEKEEELRITPTELLFLFEPLFALSIRRY